MLITKLCCFTLLIQAVWSEDEAAKPVTPGSPKGPDYCNMQELYPCATPEINSQHIFCNCKSHKCNYFMTENMSEFREFVMKWHNTFRNTIALGQETENVTYGGPIPEAADMNALSWNYVMEDTARCNAKKCTIPLQLDACHATPIYPRMAHGGQNLFRATDTTCRQIKGVLKGCDPNTMSEWEVLVYSAIRYWYEELKDVSNVMIFENFRNDPLKKIYHMTNMLWAETTDVGCAVTADEKERNFFVTCNYFPTGNILGQKVFTKGPGASKCHSDRPAGQAPDYKGLCGSAVLPPDPGADFFVSPPTSVQLSDGDVSARGKRRRSSAPKTSPVGVLCSFLTGIYLLITFVYC